MFRVLAPGGRVLLSTWRSRQHNPYTQAFSTIVEKQVGPIAGEESRTPYDWDSHDEMRRHLSTAGFTNISIEPVTIRSYSEELQTYILNDLLAYPITGNIVKGWSPAQRKALVEEITEALSNFKTGDGWAIPRTANVAVAVKPAR